MRDFPAARNLQRSSSQQSPRWELVIVCEGKNTEPQYFEECVRYYGAGTVRLQVMPAAGVPLTLIKAAIAVKNDLVQSHRKNGDSFDACFRVWAVFDRDAHPYVSQALELAKRFSIDVAFSNPCFELWPLLHLEDFGAQLDRHALQSRLESKMPGYDHADGALIDFELIKDQFPDAYIRARRHNLNREEELSPLSNPSTTVGVLVRKIIENGKYANREMLKFLDSIPANPSVPQKP